MWSMLGECTGNVRSTPTPYLSLRTVKVSRTPPPWRRSTTPLNTWIRSLAPSMTFTWTLIVSPGLKAGRSSRSDVLSTKSSVFMSEDTSLRSRLRAAAHRCEQVSRQPSRWLGHLGASRGRRERTVRPTTAGDNWSIVPDRAHAAKSRRIAAAADPIVTWANGTHDREMTNRTRPLLWLIATAAVLTVWTTGCAKVYGSPDGPQPTVHTPESPP